MVHVSEAGKARLSAIAKGRKRGPDGRFLPMPARNDAKQIDVDKLIDDPEGTQGEHKKTKKKKKRKSSPRLKKWARRANNNATRAADNRRVRRLQKQSTQKNREPLGDRVRRYGTSPKTRSAIRFSKAMAGYTKWLFTFKEPARHIEPNKVRVLGDKQTAKQAMDSLVGVAKDMGLKVSAGSFDDGSLGEYSKEKKKITLSGKQSLPSLVSTMSHELCHAFDPWVQKMGAKHYEDHKWDYEGVAQLASNIVCEQLGIDNRERTAVYIKHWTGRRANDSIKDPAMRSRAEAAAAQILLRIKKTAGNTGAGKKVNYSTRHLESIAEKHKKDALSHLRKNPADNFSRNRVRRKDRKAAARAAVRKKLTG